MSVLKFDRNSVLSKKSELTSLQNDLNNTIKNVDNNFELLKNNWKGNKSNVTLLDLVDLSKAGANLLKRVDENINYLDGAIKIYDQSENVQFASSTNSEHLKEFFPKLPRLNMNENLYSINFDGKEYFVINSAIDPFEYGEIVLSKGLSQKNAWFSGCLMVAQFYAMEILLGNKTTYNSFLKLSGSPSSNINNSIKSENLEDVKESLYDLLNDRKPAVIKVTSSQVSRHYVTAIGYTADVTSSKDLNENNILVLDPATGKISTLADSGWGNRKFLAQQNEFEVIGPNEEFMSYANQRELQQKG